LVCNNKQRKLINVDRGLTAVSVSLVGWYCWLSQIIVRLYLQWLILCCVCTENGLRDVLDGV